MGSFDQMTPAEREQLKQLRDRGLRSLKKICLLQLGLSVVSIVVGIVAVAFSAVNPQFPYIIAAPIWTAILVAVGAACGFLAARNGINRDDVDSKVKVYVIVHYVFNVLCVTICLMSAGVSVLGIVFCQSDDPKLSQNCQPNKTALLATSAMSVIVGLFLSVLSILGTCYFCCYGRTLGFKSKREQRMDRRLKAMQMQLDDMKAQAQAQGQGYIQGQDQGYLTWESKQ